MVTYYQICLYNQEYHDSFVEIATNIICMNFYKQFLTTFHTSLSNYSETETFMKRHNKKKFTK